MKKVLLCMLFCVHFFCIALAQFSGGSGSVSDPFLVSSKAELDSVRNYLSFHFRQTQDIAFSGSDFEVGGDFHHDGAGWLPLGTLTGSYDGGGHIIDSLFIDRSTEDFVGLFSFLESGASIKNLGLTECSITGKTRSGTLVGESLGSIDSAFVTGNVTVLVGGGLVGLNRGVINDSYTSAYITTPGIRDSNVGGLVNYNEGTITGCYTTGDVVGYGAGPVGGLIASNYGYIKQCYTSGNVGCAWGGISGGLVADNYLHISHSYSTGAVSGITNTGGLVGNNNANGVIEYCYALGPVTDIGISFQSNNTGGFAGANVAGTIKNCYARGAVSLSPSNTDQTDYMAGFIGKNYRGVIEKCYSTGRVTHHSDDNLGFVAFVDTNGAYSMSGNFWDFETSNQPTSAGEATGLTTTAMKMSSTFTSAAWDFTDVWAIDDNLNDGYPYLLLPVEAIAPSIATDSIQYITKNSALVHYSIIDPGAPTITQHGVCWNQFGEPSIDDQLNNEGSVDTSGIFTSRIDSLNPNTLYYVRAYAMNVVDTVYGDEMTFTTLGLPEIQELSIADFDTNNVKARALITDLGNPTINEHGFAWASDVDIPATFHKIFLGATDSLGTFSSVISGLRSKNSYKIFAFASNENDTVYTDTLTFMTLGLPVVTTLSVSDVDTVYARVFAEISDLGNPSPTQHGFCWSTDMEPTIEDDKVELGAVDSIINFSYDIDSLIENTKYYVRAYAVNTVGTVYGDTLSFTTLKVSIHDMIPLEFALLQNYPNPFNPITSIMYNIMEPGDVELNVFDMRGRKVATLIDCHQDAGSYKLDWDASNVSSGIYFYHLRCGDFLKTKKMILMK